MDELHNFDDIRPYYDSEIPEAMHRIAESVSFPLLASYVYPGENIEDVRERVRNYTNIRDFQHETMYKVNQQVINNSIANFSCEGLENIDPRKAYLYVSNHRDIMLDSSLLQYHLVKKGYDTTEITFGANLMINQLVIDIGKSNKMFKVERPGGSAKEFYHSSKHLSEYIRNTICEKIQSAWIAQRNGRTKDGNDQTDQGIIKMFCMSKADDKIAAIEELHIVPVAISYEWEPCDVLKAIEMYQSEFTKYTKKPGEDLNSVLTGIIQQKGQVHIQLCQPIIKSDIEKFSLLTTNEYHRAVANLISQRIIEGYKLFANNYIAYDIRYGSKRFASMYTKEQREAFENRLEELEAYDSCDLDKLRDIFIGIYSNPVKNKLNQSETR